MLLLCRSPYKGQTTAIKYCNSVRIALSFTLVKVAGNFARSLSSTVVPLPTPTMEPQKGKAEGCKPKAEGRRQRQRCESGVKPLTVTTSQNQRDDTGSDEKVEAG